MLLLDTDVVIDVSRGHEPAVRWLLEEGSADVVLPGYVVMELLQGCQNKQDQRAVLRQVEFYRILWPSAEACDRAIDLFAQHHLSDGLDLLDALIAALALEQNVPLHSFNEKHYRPIPGLTLVQPYSRGA